MGLRLGHILMSPETVYKVWGHGGKRWETLEGQTWTVMLIHCGVYPGKAPHHTLCAKCAL